MAWIGRGLHKYYNKFLFRFLKPCLKNLSFWQGDNDYANNQVLNQVEGGSSIAALGGSTMIGDGSTTSIKAEGYKTIDQQYYYFAAKITTPATLKDQGIIGHSYAGSANRSGFYIVGSTLNFIWQLTGKAINVNVNTLISGATTYDAIVTLDRLGNLEFWLDGTKLDVLTTSINEGSVTSETFPNDLRIASYGTTTNTDLAALASNSEYFHVKFGSGQLTAEELADSSLIEANIYDSCFSESDGALQYNKADGTENEHYFCSYA